MREVPEEVYGFFDGFILPLVHDLAVKQTPGS